MDFRVGAGTNVGNVRDHNEDSFCVNRKANLYIVADGMGGHAAGEIASNQLKDFIEEYLLREGRPASESVTDCLTQGVKAANKSIYQMGIDDPEKRGMGTTATIFTVQGDRYIIAHVGDSRCYLLRDNQLFQLTRDHSRVYQLYESGLITKEEMEDHPMSNVITRSIGNHPTVDPDVYEGDLVAGDRFLLCSDGLSGEVKETELEQIMRSKDLPQEQVDKLIQRALEEGGKDNVTCLVIEVRAGKDERRKTVPLTLDQLKRMPPPKAVVERIEIEPRSEPPKPAVERSTNPGSRSGAKRPPPASGLYAGGVIAGVVLTIVVGALLLSGPSGGSLQITSEAEGAEIYLDNQYQGNTPTTLNDIPPGTYEVRVQIEAGRAERTVEVKAGVLEPLHFTTSSFRPR